MNSGLPQSELVRLASEGSLRIIELNRPKALNALNGEMIAALTEALRVWEKSSNCSAILLKSSSSPRAFCSGGDVVGIVQLKGKVAEQSEFFRKEYALNHLMGSYSKPIIAILDGITMGGGVGISAHGQFRVATENTVVAMPETAIGFFPDVGASFLLPRLEGALGTYLALTGARLKGIDVYLAGFATHFVPSTRIPHLLATLSGNLADSGSAALASLLEQFSGEYEPGTLAEHVSAINHCFSANSLAEIIERIKSTKGDPNPKTSQWAQQTLDTLQHLSPTALLATHELLRRGSGLTLKGCLRMEYNLTKNFICHVADMTTGITERLINKNRADRLAWSPATLEQIADPSALLNRLFQTNLVLRDELEFYNSIDFERYPHQDHALPTVARVKELVFQHRNLADRQPLIDRLLTKYDHKMGLAPLLDRLIQTHVKTRAELEAVGHVALSNLNWQDK